MKYPEYIMKTLRQNSGLEKDDTSHDKVFESFSKRMVFDRLLIWEGIIGYSGRIIGFIEDVYGVKLEEDD